MTQSTKLNQDDMALLEELLEAGRIVPVINRCYPLVETADAFHYFTNEHPRGIGVITKDPDHETGHNKP